MPATMFSSHLLRRLSRTVLLGGVVFLPLAACGGDDDDDGPTGPSADCIDEIDFEAFGFFEENDVEALSLNDSESGTISESDPEFDFGDGEIFYYDIYVVALENEGDVTVTVNPSGDADADFEIIDLADGSGLYVNNAGPGDTESETFVDAAEGCYLLLVSNAEVEGTGSYTVEVSD